MYSHQHCHVLDYTIVFSDETLCNFKMTIQLALYEGSFQTTVVQNMATLMVIHLYIQLLTMATWLLCSISSVNLPVFSQIAVNNGNCLCMYKGHLDVTNISSLECSCTPQYKGHLDSTKHLISRVQLYPTIQRTP